MSADMVELAFLRYVLTNGGQDIESSNDVLAICQRIAELEKRIKWEKYHAKSFQRFLLESQKRLITPIAMAMGYISTGIKLRQM